MPATRPAVTILLLASLALAAPRDLRARYGGGWAGLKKGSTVTMKVTVAVPKKVPFVQVQTTTLKKVGKSEFELEQLTKNQLTPDRKQSWTTPATGEARAGEKETAKKLDGEKITAAGRKWDCTKREITVTGKAGKRVITDWTAKNPLLRIKRIEKTYDPAGKSVSTQSIVLSELPQMRLAGEKKVSCVGYRSIKRMGKREQRQDSWHSRSVPGDIVSLEMKQYQGGKLVSTVYMRVLRFVAK
jgi:hypothetical protein